jgi:hypothetical protein
MIKALKAQMAAIGAADSFFNDMFPVTIFNLWATPD